MTNSIPKDLENRITSLLKTRLLSVSQIAKELKIRRDFATGYLEALRNQGKLDLHRIGKSNVYTIAGRLKR